MRFANRHTQILLTYYTLIRIEIFKCIHTSNTNKQNQKQAQMSSQPTQRIFFSFFFCFLFFPFVFMNGTKMMSDNQAVQNKPVEQPNALF